MRKSRFLQRVFAVPLLMLTMGAAQAAIILPQQSTWNYNVTAQNLGFSQAVWAGYDFDTFSANYTGASSGQAGFGNAGAPAGGAVNTPWAAGTDLALQTTIDVGGAIVGDVTLNLGVDNGAIVFVNGVEVFSQMAEGFASIWEYSQSISGGLFNSGLNTISVLTEDHGGLTFFDMELVAEVAVPEPSLIALGAVGLLGLGLARRRRLA